MSPPRTGEPFAQVSLPRTGVVFSKCGLLLGPQPAHKSRTSRPQTQPYRIIVLTSRREDSSRNSLSVLGNHFSTIGRDEHADDDGIDAGSEHFHMSIAEDDLSAVGMEAENLIVGAAIVGGDPVASRRAVAAIAGIGVVVDGDARLTGGRSRHTEAAVRFGPAPEGAVAVIAAARGILIRRHLWLDAAAILGDGDGVAGAVGEFRQRRATESAGSIGSDPVQRPIYPPRFVAQAGIRIDVRVNGRTIIRVAEAGVIASRTWPQRIAGTKVGFDDRLRARDVARRRLIVGVRVHHAIHVVLLDIGQDDPEEREVVELARPGRGIGKVGAFAAAGKVSRGTIEIVDGQTYLFQIVAALATRRRLAHLLHGRQQQANENSDDG